MRYSGYVERINCDNASGKHISFGCAGVATGLFVPCCGLSVPQCAR